MYRQLATTIQMYRALAGTCAGHALLFGSAKMYARLSDVSSVLSYDTVVYLFTSAYVAISAWTGTLLWSESAYNTIASMAFNLMVNHRTMYSTGPFAALATLTIASSAHLKLGELMPVGYVLAAAGMMFAWKYYSTSEKTRAQITWNILLNWFGSILIQVVVSFALKYFRITPTNGPVPRSTL